MYRKTNENELYQYWRRARVLIFTSLCLVIYLAATSIDRAEKKECVRVCKNNPSLPKCATNTGRFIDCKRLLESEAR